LSTSATLSLPSPLSASPTAASLTRYATTNSRLRLLR
jgi:hypothetical protein